MRTLITTCWIALNTFLFCEENFLLYDLQTTQFIQEQGPHCDEQVACCSTFKIPLSLMGFDAGILETEKSPLWPFQEGYNDWLPIWKQPHSPQLWMRHSCVWFSQVLTTILGMERFQHYVDLFDYGNRDLSGDPGKNNGLTRAWLNSSLKISPREQINFLAKIVENRLPVSSHAIAMTKQILFMGELEGGWSLYGKTGSGNRKNPDGSEDPDLKMGWFVGWLEKEERTLIFAFNLLDEQYEGGGFGGLRAKEKAKERLLSFVTAL